MIRIIFNGIGGRIGQTMYKFLSTSEDYKIVAGADKRYAGEKLNIPVYNSLAEVKENADVLIDFSIPDALDEVLSFALERKLKAVVATTGHTPAQMEKINAAAKEIAVFKASNMSLGISIITSIAKETAGFLGNGYDVEIIEQHHNQKLDAPSGTALTIADAINETRDNHCEYVYGRHDAHKRREASEIGIHAVRGGSIVGKHEIMYIGNGEVITLTHESQNKEVFVAGALRAADFLMDKSCGFYDMHSIIGNMYSVTRVSVENDITLITIPVINAAKYVELLTKLGENNINLDMISQTMNSDDTVAVSLTFPDADCEKAYAELYKSGTAYFAKEHTSKITSEGAGMAHQCGVAKDVLKLLASAGATVYSITTSETKISCCVNSSAVPAAEKALKSYYGIK